MYGTAGMCMIARVSLSTIGDGHARSREGDAHLRSRISLQRVRRPAQLPSVHGLILDRDDVIAVVHAARLGRRVRIHATHDRHALLVLDEHAEPRISAARARDELGELLRRVQRRVWIVDLAHESACRLLVQVRARHRIDEAIRHEREHLVEQPRTVARGVTLDEKCAGRERHEHNGCQHGNADAGHRPSGIMRDVEITGAV